MATSARTVGFVGLGQMGFGKDLTAAVESGRSVHQAMPVTSLARELYQLVDTKLGGLHGSNEVHSYYLEA